MTHGPGPGRPDRGTRPAHSLRIDGQEREVGARTLGNDASRRLHPSSSLSGPAVDKGERRSETPSMRSNWRRGAVALALLASVSGCSDEQPEAREPTAPAATSATPAPPTTSATSAPPVAAPVDDSAQEIPVIEAALPGPAELGRFAEYSSCFARDQVCSTVGGTRDRELSWVRGSSGMGGSASSAVAEVSVTRRPAGTNLRRALRDVRRDCPLEFVVPFEARGFFPHPDLDGVSRLEPVEQAGFQGSWCAKSTVTPGFQKSWGRIEAARGDVLLSVSATGKRAALRLFREYVARLG